MLNKSRSGFNDPKLRRRSRAHFIFTLLFMIAAIILVTIARRGDGDVASSAGTIIPFIK